ncbi:unnamed protein product [Moneuplotes crassus]|uniref:Uncharacterized protein n=1 Tax=Euplotes crassus TaxID=5936 RepID=A0AAD1Y662_EUPCR|nr:unnamed protein product [Moneuplotes crassus]
MENEVSIDGCKGYVIMMIVYACVGVLTLLVQLWYSVKFLKFYGFKNIIVSIFMGFLTLSIVCDIIYGAAQAYFCYLQGCLGNKYYCLGHWTNWINYFMYMSTIIVLSFTYISQILRFKNRERRKKRIYSIVLWSTMLFILLVCTIIFIVDGVQTCRKHPKNIKIFSTGILVMTGLNMLTGLFFMFTLLCFYRALKKVDKNTNGVKLSKKLKCRLIISIAVVVFVFETRSGIILVGSITDFLDIWEGEALKHNRTWYVIYTFCYYFILSLIPTMVQIYLIKLSLSTTPRISIRVDGYHCQSEPLIFNNSGVSLSKESESFKTEDFRESQYNTS